jgi:hypothetical protein
MRVINLVVLAVWLGSAFMAPQQMIPEVAMASNNKELHMDFLDDAAPLPLSSLVGQSALIVVGKLHNERARLTPDKTSIVTTYDIQPIRLLFDKNAMGTIKLPEELLPLAVTVLGGRLEIGDKIVWLHDSTRRTWDPASVMVLFLKRDESGTGNGQYVLAGGNAGLFRLTAEQELRSLLRHNGDDGELELMPLAELSQRIGAASR